MELRVKEQNDSTITFEWTPPSDADYYVFYVDGLHISDGPAIDKNGVEKTTVRFSKGNKLYEVVCIRYGKFNTDVGSYPLGIAISEATGVIAA
jgi:hypothetical protein